MASRIKNAGVARWILAGIVLGTFLKLFAFDILTISGTSMEPALHEGAVVVVNKFAYGLVRPGNRTFFVQWKTPAHDDIVIYLHDDKIVIKRCIALGGNRLEYFTNPEYTLHVGEKSVTLTAAQYAHLHASTTVPDGYVLAVGDNYTESIDSRDYGFVSVKNIVGRVIGR